MCIFHKWTKWERFCKEFIIYPGYLFPNAAPYNTTEAWQKRECEKCGLKQEKEIE